MTRKHHRHLLPGEPLGAEVRRLLFAELSGAVRKLKSGDPPDDEAIYAARKSIKRLRSTLRLVRRGIGNDVFRAWNNRLRDASHTLGLARERAALLAIAEHLVSLATAPDGPSRATAVRLVRLAGLHGEATADAVATAAAASDVAEDLDALCREVLPWRASADGKVIETGLLTAYARGAKDLREGLETGDTETLHEARKRVVHLRYQLEAISSAWPRPIKAFLREAQELREVLGDFNDLTELVKAIEDPASPLHAVPRCGDWLALAAGECDRLKAAVRERGVLVFAEEPAAFAARHRAYWQAASQKAIARRTAAAQDVALSKERETESA